MPKPSRPSASTPLWDYNIRSLLTHRVLVLSNTFGRGAVRLYASRYGVLLAEWRLLGALAVEAPSSVTALAATLSMDKGALSRTAAALVKKGLVEMRPDSTDARRTEIGLTAAGRELYARVLPAAMDRQRRLLSVLTPVERAMLDKVLAKLQLQAEMLADAPIPANDSDKSARRSKGRRRSKQSTI